MQADLTQLPFQGSVDFLFLDHTLAFLPDSDLGNFAKSVGDALSYNGVALVINSEPVFSNRLAKLFRSRANHRDVYPKKNSKIISEVKEYLRPSLIGTGDFEGIKPGIFSIIALTKYSSKYGQHEGPPFAFFHDAE